MALTKNKVEFFVRRCKTKAEAAIDKRHRVLYYGAVDRWLKEQPEVAGIVQDITRALDIGSTAIKKFKEEVTGDTRSLYNYPQVLRSLHEVNDVNTKVEELFIPVPLYAPQYVVDAKLAWDKELEETRKAYGALDYTIGCLRSPKKMVAVLQEAGFDVTKLLEEENQPEEPVTSGINTEALFPCKKRSPEDDNDDDATTN